MTLPPENPPPPVPPSLGIAPPAPPSLGTVPPAAKSAPATVPPATPPPADDLQFDRAEFGGATQQPAPSTCSACQQPITGAYYAAGEHVVCPACREQIIASMTGGSAVGRLFRATAFGILAGLAGALLWFGVRKVTGYEIGLIAVVVGFAVGAAVRRGSDGRGGVAYQILAVLITYCCIVSTYVPDIYAAAAAEPDAADAPAAVIMIFAIIISFAAPVLMGFQNIIGMLIIAFALWEAWKINKYRKVEFAGPFFVGGAGGGATPPPFPPPPPLTPAGTT